MLDVVAVKTPKLRGQAHIVYRDIETSTVALKALQGFEFYGKPMVSSYSFSQETTLVVFFSSALDAVSGSLTYSNE